MPELPEVENVCRGIESTAKNKVIKKIHWTRKDIRFPLPLDEFAKIQNAKILRVHRRAKYILFDLGETTMINHLGMTGVWRWNEKPDEVVHDHVALEFEDGKFLVFNDPRRFGFFDCSPSKALNLSKWFKHLGPEPLEAEFNAEYLAKIISGRKAPIKNFLMDQKNVVGVGNIYASEALFLAGIRPMRPAGKVKAAEVGLLVESIQEVLSTSIANGGTTLRDFRNVYGDLGTNEAELFVYGREGEYCHMCSYPIKMKVMAGRSTFWCPDCQR